MTRVAELLGVGTPETVRKGCPQAQVDTGQRAGVTTEESAKLHRLSSRPNSTGYSVDRAVH